MSHQENPPFRVSTVTRKASERNAAKPITKQFKVIFMNQAMEISLWTTDFQVSVLIPRISSIFEATYPNIQAYLVDIRQTETDNEVASLTEITSSGLYELKIRPEGMSEEEMKEEMDEELINDEPFKRMLTSWKEEMLEYTFKSNQTDPSTHFKEGVIKVIKFQRKKGNKRTFKCPFFQCNKFFAESGNLRTHLRTHTGARPFTCEECNKSFITKGHLNSHQLIHTGDRPFICPYDGCRKCYSRSGRLKIHMRSHVIKAPNQTGQKPYVCTFPNCEKSFTERGNLKTHLRIHFGQKPHECTVCGKKFVTNGHLKDHFRTHSDEKPYQCPQCEKTYKRISTLHIHMKQTHNIIVKSNKVQKLQVKKEEYDHRIKRENKLNFKEEEKAAKIQKENDLQLIKIPLNNVKASLEMQNQKGSPNDGFSSFSKSVCSKMPMNFGQALQIPSMDMPRLSLPSEEGIESPKKPHLTKAQLDLINARRQPEVGTPQNLFPIPLDPRMDRSPNAGLLNPSSYLHYNFPTFHDPLSSLSHAAGGITPRQLELFKGGLTPSNFDLFQGGLTPGGFQKLSDGLGTPHALNLFCGNSSPSPNLLGRYQLQSSLIKSQHQQNLETVKNLLNGGAESIQNSPFHHPGLGAYAAYLQPHGHLNDSINASQLGNHNPYLKSNLGLTPSNKSINAQFDNFLNNFKMLTAPSPSSNNIASKNTRVSLSSAFSDFKEAANRNTSSFGTKISPQSPTKLVPRMKNLNEFPLRNREDSQSSLALTPLNQSSFPNTTDYQGHGASCFGEAAMMSQFRAPSHGGNSVINRQCNLVSESPHGQVRQSNNSLFRPSK